MKSLDEFYEALDRALDLLAGSGHAERAERLRSLVYGQAWTTSSELLGELGMALGEPDPGLSDEERASLAELRHFCRHHRALMGLG